jgi:translation initiation factor IF-2
MAEKTIQIEEMITVGDLAGKLDIPVTGLIAELMRNGVMATVNERIDFDTAQIVTAEIKADVELVKKAAGAQEHVKREARVVSDKAVTRPPVIAVMGHVDHGKTSLLDAIREADVAKGEAGGITQHISAYQITYSDRLITFLDTPGHEAFAALRQHGADITDVAVIVIAADDGIKPQTKEAIRFAQNAGVKLIIAVNKVDKPEADVNRVKQELAENNLMVEEWGGDTIVVEVSAKTKHGIDKLLDMILLVADVEELKADEVGVPAGGVIIEAHMEQGRGPVATALVEQGILKPGALLVAGGAYAKVKTLQDANSQQIKEAKPSTPVIITGFKSLPRFGDSFLVQKDEKTARQLAASNSQKDTDGRLQMSSTDLIAMIDKKREQQPYNVILKSDVQGSLKSVVDSLSALENSEVTARVVGKGVGGISESDVMMAASTGAVIYGFSVDLPTGVRKLASREQVTIRVFNVIYELIDDVKENMSSLLAPEIVENEAGRLIVRGVFMIKRDQVICGGEVTKGKIVPGLIAKITRDKEVIAEAEVSKVQRQQSEVKEVVEGDMCGLELKTHGRVAVEEGDRIDFVSRELITRKL